MQRQRGDAALQDFAAGVGAFLHGRALPGWLEYRAANGVRKQALELGFEQLLNQFAKGDPGYQLQAGDAYFREGPFINEFAEISPGTLFGLDCNNATSFGSFGAPYCKPDSGPIRRYCSMADVR